MDCRHTDKDIADLDTAIEAIITDRGDLSEEAAFNQIVALNRVRACLRNGYRMNFKPTSRHEGPC